MDWFYEFVPMADKKYLLTKVYGEYAKKEAFIQCEEFPFVWKITQFWGPDVEELITIDIRDKKITPTPSSHKFLRVF